MTTEAPTEGDGSGGSDISQAQAPPRAAPAEPNPVIEKGDRGREEWEIQRDGYKVAGDAAFRAKDYASAVSAYTNGLSVDPSHHLLLSNRSAAYLARGEKSRALADARGCVGAAPGFAKGHSRLAAALWSLERWKEAGEAYGAALEIEPSNAVARQGADKCRERDREEKRAEVERVKAEMERAKRRQEEEEKDQQKKKRAEEEKCKAKGKMGDASVAAEEGDDFLDAFFADVEKKAGDGEDEDTGDGGPKEPPTISNGNESDPTGGESDEKKIKTQLSDLGTADEQIDRILANNHEWRNLNPFFVLACPHDVPEEVISRRYKALSLLLHPDKNPDPRAGDAFEQVRRAMTVLNDDTRAKHARDLVEQGLKQGRRELGNVASGGSAGADPARLVKAQEVAIMKIFAEVERSRREVEARKRAQEKRERDQEDEEARKVQAEAKFNRKWKKQDRVDNRIGNWRDFQKKKQRKT